MKTAQTIEKEEIEQLKFPDTEVLLQHNERVNRNKSLEKALALGNLEKVKVKIAFEDAEGLKVVHTTIWGITEKNILLKGNRRIPMNRIHSIDFV
ncbi:hypothetical protein GC194_07355 [bacterium]|nr:hypothetical protein [bacterium]